MKHCWSPWYYYDNVKSGSFACAATSIFFSVFSVTYISYCLTGGESSQFFLPLFETDVRSSMKIAGGIMIVFYLLYIFNAILVIQGIRMELRGMVLPWLTQNFLYILMIIAYSIWLQASYYHYIYMHRCVKAQYDIIKARQALNIIQFLD